MVKTKKSPKLHLVIESTHYRKDRLFEKPEFDLLRALSRHKLIQIHIPWFVYMESVSTYLDDASREFDQAVSTLQSLHRKGLDNALTGKLQSFAGKLSALRPELEKSIKNKWGEFIKETGAILYTYDPADSISVFDAYFSGGKPFPVLKSRPDIPDAFIYQTLLQIAKSNPVHVVSGDGNLRKQLEVAANINTYKEFKDLFEAQIFKEIEAEYARIEKYNALKAKLLKRTVEISALAEANLMMMSPFGIRNRYFSSDDNQATINNIENETVEIQTNEIIFADDNFYVPIKITGTASVDYYLFKSRYYLLAEEISRKIAVSDWNKHYFLAEETVPVILIVKVTIPKEQIEKEEAISFTFDLEKYSEVYVDLDKESQDILGL